MLCSCQYQIILFYYYKDYSQGKFMSLIVRSDYAAIKIIILLGHLRNSQSIIQAFNVNGDGTRNRFLRCA